MSNYEIKDSVAKSAVSNANEKVSIDVEMARAENRMLLKCLLESGIVQFTENYEFGPKYVNGNMRTSVDNGASQHGTVTYTITMPSGNKIQISLGELCATYPHMQDEQGNYRFTVPAKATDKPKPIRDYSVAPKWQSGVELARKPQGNKGGLSNL